MLETIPEDLQQFVRNELGSGHYRSTRDLLVDGLRLLQRDRAEAAQGIQNGLNDVEAGRFQPLKEAFDELRTKLQEDEVRILHVRRAARDTASPEDLGE